MEEKVIASDESNLALGVKKVSNEDVTDKKTTGGEVAFEKAINEKGVDKKMTDKKIIDKKGANGNITSEAKVNEQGLNTEAIDKNASDEKIASEAKVDNQALDKNAADCEAIGEEMPDGNATGDKVIDNQTLDGNATGDEAIGEGMPDKNATSDQVANGFDSIAKSASEKILATLKKAIKSREFLKRYILNKAPDKDVASSLADEYSGEGDEQKVTELFATAFDEFIDEFYSYAIADGRRFRLFINNKAEAFSKLLKCLAYEDATELASTCCEEDELLYKAVSSAIFVFDDIVTLGDRSVQKLLREVDQKDLAIALKACKKETLDKVCQNMSKRSAAMLIEDIEYMGAMKKADIQAAQDRIASTVLRLGDSGEIVIPRPWERGELIGDV